MAPRPHWKPCKKGIGRRPEITSIVEIPDKSIPTSLGCPPTGPGAGQSVPERAAGQKEARTRGGRRRRTTAIEAGGGGLQKRICLALKAHVLIQILFSSSSKTSVELNNISSHKKSGKKLWNRGKYVRRKTEQSESRYQFATIRASSIFVTFLLPAFPRCESSSFLFVEAFCLFMPYYSVIISHSRKRNTNERTPLQKKPTEVPFFAFANMWYGIFQISNTVRVSYCENQVPWRIIVQEVDRFQIGFGGWGLAKVGKERENVARHTVSDAAKFEETMFAGGFLRRPQFPRAT